MNMHTPEAQRVTRKYLAIGIAWGALLCALAAFGMVRVIYWRLDQCVARSSTRCDIAIWLIDFWWLPFLALVLGGAWLLRRARDRRLAGVAGPAS